MKKIFLILLPLMFVACACEVLEVQDNYCEIAFAYPIDEPLPDELYKELIGCACTKKDILKGVEVGEWKSAPLEKCRRVRGFAPIQWKETIDPYFQYQSAKKELKK